MYGSYIHKLVIKIYGIWTSLSLRQRRRKRLEGNPCACEVANTDRMGSVVESSDTEESRGVDAAGSEAVGDWQASGMGVSEPDVDKLYYTLGVDKIGSGSEVGEMTGGGGTIDKLVVELEEELHNDRLPQQISKTITAVRKTSKKKLNRMNGRSKIISSMALEMKHFPTPDEIPGYCSIKSTTTHSLCLEHRQVLSSSPSGFRPPPWANVATPASAGAKPWLVFSMASQSHNTVNQRQPTSRTSGQNFPIERRLSGSEYQHRRARGLCFHCDERWTPTHQCKNLFLLVLDDTMEIDPDIVQANFIGLKFPCMQ
nr:Ty3/gypsy retrotransposon protein [Ipomoea batatas]